ncbi:MAG: antitoxin Xre-like helix-turn-helix domain-containing protein [Desulfovibrionaceae bacterium]
MWKQGLDALFFEHCNVQKWSISCRNLALSFIPQAGHDPSPCIDLSSPLERERLSPSAIKAFFNIMERWKTSEAVGRALLGGVSRGRYHSLKKGRGKLDQDELTRVSLLVGVFKALHILHSEKLADAWMSLPNRNRIFGGGSPLDYLVHGGLPAFLNVRRLLDARREGV